MNYLVKINYISETMLKLKIGHSPEVRKIIYTTTNAIESMHMQLRKIVRNRGHFPSDEAASKLLYLVLHNIEKD